MRLPSTSIVLAALSANVHGLAIPQPSEDDTQGVPQPYWWEGPASASLKEKIYSAPSAIPLPTLKPLVDVSIRTTAVHIQTPAIQHGSETPTIYTTAVAPAPNSSSVPVYQASSMLSWAPDNSIYVAPSNAPSITIQPSQSLAYSAPNSPSPIATTPVVAYSSPAGSIAVASSPAVTVADVQTNQGYTPGVIPSSTPGVIPSYTPGVVPSLTPGVVPSPATSQAPSVSAIQPTIPASAPISASQSPSSGPTASGSAVPTTTSALIATSLAPSAISSIQSSLASAASSPGSVSSSQASVSASVISTPTFQLSSSPAASATSVPNSSQSTLATTSSRPSSANTQGTGIPPAPSAGGSSGSLSARGKERVWWVAFLVPLAFLM